MAVTVARGKVRYAIVARNVDSAVRVFGTFHELARAEAFADSVNARIEAREDREFEEWQRAPRETSGNAPEGYGRVGVLIVHPWSATRAERFARGEYQS